MVRIFCFIAVFYLIALGIVDTVALNGRYQRMAWNAASYQVQHAYYEVRVILDRMGVASTASARP